MKIATHAASSADARDDSPAGAGMKAIGPLPRWRHLADIGLGASVPLWVALAGLLAAAMGTWPLHIYI